MNAKEATWIKDNPSAFNPYEKGKASGYLEALQGEEVKELVEALDDIKNFHEKGLEEIEKRRGWLGWTCCGQLTRLAEKALSKYYEFIGESK